MPIPTPGLAGASLVVMQERISSITTTTQRLARIRMPFAVDVLGISVNARQVSGTAPSLSVDLVKGTSANLAAPGLSASLLAGPAVVTAADTLAEALPTATAGLASLDDERDLYVAATVSGTTPVFTDVDVTIIAARRGL
jgi:hypothetical protein